jgi:ABC-2 type transport system permease protein
VVLLGAQGAVSALSLVLLAPPVGLSRGLDPSRIVAATAATTLLALTFAALAFAVGAATGRRSLAISVASAVAVAGFVVEGLAAQVKVLSPVQEASPWHWLLSSDPLRNGLTWRPWILPLAVSLVLVLAGAAVFWRRDLR